MGTILKLTPAQFAFMQQHHEAIERSMTAELTGSPDMIPMLEASPEYKALFGEMLWDDAYDRYEDTRGYDSTLKHSIKAAAAHRPEPVTRQTADLTSAADLIALRESSRKPSGQ